MSGLSWSFVIGRKESSKGLTNVGCTILRLEVLVIALVAAVVVILLIVDAIFMVVGDSLFFETREECVRGGEDFCTTGI